MIQVIEFTHRIKLESGWTCKVGKCVKQFNRDKELSQPWINLHMILGPKI